VAEDRIFTAEGLAGDRLDTWTQAVTTKDGVYITNAGVFYSDFPIISQIPWAAVIADEYHKFMRSYKVHIKGRVKTYGKFLQMTRNLPIVVLATGSLVRRNASSMFTAFQLSSPRRFSSYWRFVEKYAYVDDTGFGKAVEGVRNAEELRALMDLYFAYIPPEVVADQLPEGARIGIDVDITDEQCKIYRDLNKEMMSFLESGGVIVTPNVLARIVRLRQLLCCPRILDPSLGMGAGFEAITDRLDQDEHVAIFVPFRAACDCIADELKRKGYKNVFILRGGVKGQDLQDVVDQFRDTRGILVCTIQYAESFDLETCKTSYFLGYDLTVDQNEQAEGRTRRAISTHDFVTWNYIKTNTPLDQHFLYRLGNDQRNAHLILQRPDEYVRMLLQETRN
jgi:hypothetical protein